MEETSLLLFKHTSDFFTETYGVLEGAPWNFNFIYIYFC